MAENENVANENKVETEQNVEQVESNDDSLDSENKIEEDLAFKNMIESREEQEPEKVESEPNDQGSKEKITTTDTKTEQETKEEFIFDSEKYKKEGIEDEKILKTLEERDKKIYHQEKLIGKQGQKMGENKEIAEQKIKKLESRIEELNKHKKLTDEEYNELADENLSKALKQREMDQAIEKERQELEVEKKMLVNKRLVLESIEGFDGKIQGIKEILKSEATEELAEEFIKEPYSFPPALTINLAKRVELQNQLAEKENKINELEAKLKDAPNKVVNRLKTIGKNVITPPTSEKGKSKDTAYDEMSIGLMSMEELQDD